jgi:protein kinase-like protein
VSSPPPGPEESGRKRRWSFSLPEEKELTELGPYKILGTLGKGNQGEVYRAHDPALGREVALKVLRARTATARARFQREAEATAALDHPGIVRVHASGQAGDLSYVVYELIEGARTLEEVFAERPRPAEVGTWILEATRALGAAHAAGIVHRDLKPANLLLDAEGKVRVADFGLAQTEEGVSLTATQAAVGTPLYMSPEQITGGDLGPAADVWGLGVVLYQGLCGELPFQAETLTELATLVLRAQPAPPRALAPGVPAALEAVCLRCLTREPSARYPDGAALAAALADALSGAKATHSLPGARVALGLVICLAIAGALASLLPGPSDSVPPTQAPADPLSFERALWARRWGVADQEAARARDSELWRLRLAAERGAEPAALQARFRAAFAPNLRGSSRAQGVAALCSARAAFARGESILASLRASQPPLRWRGVALAEVLLCAGRPHEARDALAELPSPGGGPVIMTWCDEPQLRAALDELCGGAEITSDWSQRAPAWRRAAARWLRDEARHLLEWVLRARERAHLPQAAEDPTPRIRALLASAARLSEEPEGPLLSTLLDPLSLARAEALPPAIPQGSLAAQALRRGAAAALEATPISAEALRPWLTLSERIQPTSKAGPDLWGWRTQEQAAQAWIEGRLALALGETERALAALERADPHGRHPGVAEDLLRAAERSGQEVALERARTRLELLRGARRDEAAAQIRALRSRYREGPAPAAQLAATRALDPLNPETNFAQVLARFQLGEAAAEDLIRVSERWLFFGCGLHRQFFERCVTPEVTSRLGRTMLPLLRQRATPLGAWILDGLAGELREISAEDARALLDRAPGPAVAPGSLAPRLTRAFLAIRAGSLGCAEAELAWVRRISPNHGLARFYHTLLLGKRGAPPAEVARELELALLHGFQSQKILTWSPSAYPELSAYPTDARSPLGQTLRKRGWKPRKRDR